MNPLVEEGTIHRIDKNSLLLGRINPSFVKNLTTIYGVEKMGKAGRVFER